MDYYTYLRNLEFMNQMNNNYDISRVEVEPWPLTFQNKSQQYLLNKAIENVKNFIMDENEDAQFYNKLIALAPDEEQKKIIEDIRDDEKVHTQIFRKIFTELTGVVLPTSPQISNEVTTTSLTYKDGLKKALFGELDAVKKYREIMAYMPKKDLADMFFYVLSDEIRHANKYNYLISISQ